MIENRSDKKLRILETSERSGEVSKIAAGRTEPDKVLSRPNPEVPAKATRRRFSARYKLRILEQIKEQVREIRAGALIQDLWQDLRYGARQLGRSPGFTLVAVLSLALVIGANSTIFSVLNPILFNSLPYDDADRLVVLSEVKIDQPNQQRNPPGLTYSEWNRQAQSFEQMARVTPVPQGVTISARGQAETGVMNRVTPTFLPLLGVRTATGPELYL